MYAGLLFLVATILLGSFVVIRLSYAAWSEPSVAPPGNNTNPPVDTSSTSQNKTGALTVGSTTNFTATGMYAPIYYDANNTSYYIQPSNSGASANLAGQYLEIDNGSYLGDNAPGVPLTNTTAATSYPTGLYSALLYGNSGYPSTFGYLLSMSETGNRNSMAQMYFSWDNYGDNGGAPGAPAYLWVRTNRDSNNQFGTWQQDLLLQQNGDLNVGYDGYGSGNAHFSGDVGIGTTSPGDILSVAGSFGGGNLVSLVNNTASGESSIIYESNSQPSWVAGNGPWGNPGEFIIGDGGAMFAINSSGNVGIGTTSPSERLDVENSTGFNGIKVGNSGGSYISIFNDGNSHIEGSVSGGDLWINGDNNVITNIGAAGGDTIINQSSGGVGIGTGTISSELNINGLGPSGLSQISMIYGNYGAMWRNDGGNTYFLLTNSGDQYGGWNSLRPFTINDMTGQVSIGQLNNSIFSYTDSIQGYDTSIWSCNNCSSDGTFLNVGNTSNTFDTITSVQSFSYPTGSQIVTFTWDGYLPATSLSFSGFGFGSIMFVNDYTESDTLISVCGLSVPPTSGNCGSASTSSWEALSANYAGAEHTFKIVMTATTAAFYIDGTQVGPTMTYSISGSTVLYGRTYDANQYIKIKTINITSTISGAAQALTVGNSGDGSYAVANAWNTFSDRRFKKNINPIPPTTALQDILSLQGVTFNWIKDNQPSIGFIAQDVQKIVPQIVSADQQGYLSVDYSKITPILVQAVKKQQQEISQQNTTIAIQQQEIDQLKMKLGMQ